ncbi:GntR family transcriptional regulator [Bradyrhizobium sp. U87765 SZCCT0131]|uniref:GntR family transcriptional regulator n=1 Tax=unclassified Bradyrhizobium TaxID=2631580 RepID=UPI001BA80A1A|nr:MULTISPECIES: GntR family transcriptional regulator [unclassified Bradyrhizobium]MBR1222491.1 GntR family transcriptional regulator [Bradyrhizobium sp. U87765 SZCCT0131]MBR1265428.1 GntR family transcriptional regulator [Bradyrhizobium sp. U87765 SZCCT0134]MBR1302793.1 GntR family transcriptional regulator [Bradyrhizobium sp. U87765 SZCCT0110]MBR1323491.1 GntR family transcriptional regulator [Bradyrhizobium sp. U87765 SZCCT0109]MBR1346722.1 GntR family transcriptional regulator [Bradyrhizo
MAANRTRSQTVTDDIRELIVQGELQPGEHANEQPIAERLGVSRTPVRTALSTLASEGFLVYHPNRGYFVRRFDLSELMDAYDVRATLEGLAARRAAERGLSEEDEAAIRAALADGDRILTKDHFEPDDLLPYRAMNMAVHGTVIRAAHSARLEQAIRSAQNMPLLSDRIILWQDLPILRRSHDDHHRVLDAILHRKEWRAESLMREHVYYAGLNLQRHLRQYCGHDDVIQPEAWRDVLAS